MSKINQTVKNYKYVIAFENGDVEEGYITSDSYLSAMRLFHQRCNRYITLEHKAIKQSLLG